MSGWHILENQVKPSADEDSGLLKTVTHQWGICSLSGQQNGTQNKNCTCVYDSAILLLSFSAKESLKQGCSLQQPLWDKGTGGNPGVPRGVVDRENVLDPRRGDAVADRSSAQMYICTDVHTQNEWITLQK